MCLSWSTVPPSWFKVHSPSLSIILNVLVDLACWSEVVVFLTWDTFQRVSSARLRKEEWNYADIRAQVLMLRVALALGSAHHTSGCLKKWTLASTAELQEVCSPIHECLMSWESREIKWRSEVWTLSSWVLFLLLTKQLGIWHYWVTCVLLWRLWNLFGVSWKRLCRTLWSLR
jgi:hypothetical protein